MKTFFEELKASTNTENQKTVRTQVPELITWNKFLWIILLDSRW